MWTFLRPWFLLGLIPVFFIAAYWWFRPQQQNDWQKICDKRLLNYLQYGKGNQHWRWTWLAVMMSLVMMVLGLAGPSWHQESAPVGQVQKPTMVVMDLSLQMLVDDITPTRLDRAKFLLEDILLQHHDMQWGFIVFSEMPFLVSPVTNDAQNILNFLPVISPELLPVRGYDAIKALDKAKFYLHQAGYSYGKLVVISSRKPDIAAMDWSKKAKKEGLDTLWIYDTAASLKPNTTSGLELMDIKYASTGIHDWLNQGFFMPHEKRLDSTKVLQWKDEGRWFVILAMILIINVFRKGWFLRLWV